MTRSEAPSAIASPAMQRLMALAARVAPLDATVLVTGETGVGKERLARWLHDASPRTSGTFMAVNCAAFPDTLLDSELFGHLRGAFTGALADRAGLIETAHRGTLLLDEIGDTTLAMQVKLLRALQEREVRRVGDVKTRRIDFRLIAATNRDLDEEVARNRFRQDLFYRLRVIELNIPALRQRPEDLPRLAIEILERTARRLKRAIIGYSTQAFDCLLQFRVLPIDTPIPLASAAAGPTAHFAQMALKTLKMPRQNFPGRCARVSGCSRGVSQPNRERHVKRPTCLATNAGQSERTSIPLNAALHDAVNSIVLITSGPRQQPKRHVLDAARDALC